LWNHASHAISGRKVHREGSTRVCTPGWVFGSYASPPRYRGRGVRRVWCAAGVRPCRWRAVLSGARRNGRPRACGVGAAGQQRGRQNHPSDNRGGHPQRGNSSWRAVFLSGKHLVSRARNRCGLRHADAMRPGRGKENNHHAMGVVGLESAISD